jgi:hypothetical protein
VGRFLYNIGIKEENMTEDFDKYYELAHYYLTAREGTDEENNVCSFSNYRVGRRTLGLACSAIAKDAVER